MISRQPPRRPFSTATVGSWPSLARSWDQVLKLPCGSKSMPTASRPASRAAVSRFVAVVVLPQPPLVPATTNKCAGIGRSVRRPLLARAAGRAEGRPPPLLFPAKYKKCAATGRSVRRPFLAGGAGGGEGRPPPLGRLRRRWWRGCHGRYRLSSPGARARLHASAKQGSAREQVLLAAA